MGDRPLFIANGGSHISIDCSLYTGFCKGSYRCTYVWIITLQRYEKRNHGIRFRIFEKSVGDRFTGATDEGSMCS